MGGVSRQRPPSSRPVALRHHRRRALCDAGHARQSDRSARRGRANCRAKIRWRCCGANSPSIQRPAASCRFAAVRSVILPTISRGASSNCRRMRADEEKMPEMAIGIYDWAVVVDHLERRSWLVGQGRDPETDWKWDRLVARFSAPVAERARQPFRITGAARVESDARRVCAAFPPRASITSAPAIAIRSISRSALRRRQRATRGSRIRRCASSIRRRTRRF